MRRITATLLAGMLAASAQQQTPPQPQTPKPTVTFQSTSQLVVETVSVKDKDGKTIEGLKKEDFVITEDGKPQTIGLFDFQTMKDDVLPPAAEPTHDLSLPAEPVKIASVTRNEISGEPPGDIKYKDRRLLALYFDMTAMPVPDQLRALAAAQKFIQTQMKSADLMSIMKFAGGAVSVLNDFTDKRDELLKTIDTLAVGEGQGFDGSDADAAAADTGAAFGQDDGEFNIFNTDRQLAALQTAVRMLDSLHEKKVFIYFASGLRLNGVDNQAQLLATTNSAIRANVAFWPIDARGLVASPPLGDSTRGSPGGVGMYSGASALAMTTSFQKSQDTLYALASDTGGKAMLDYNDLAAGIVQAEQSISSYYILGYYATNNALDGRYRRIKISLKEITGKLSYREGYFAGKTFNKFGAADKERQLEDALMLGDPITDLTIAMEVDFFQLNRAEYFVPVVAKIPGSEMALARRGGAEHTLIDFIGEVKDDYGTTIQNVRDKVDIKLTGETAAQLSKHPIEYDTGFTLLPGSYSLKFLARDDETGRIGTYLTKFVIPNLDKELKRVPISSVVLSGQRMDLRDAVYSAGKAGAQAAVLAANPLVQEGQKLIPSVTRVFSKTGDMYVYLQAYERLATTTQPLVAFVTFYRGQTKAFETPPLPVTEGLDPKSKAVPLRFSIPLGKLSPGRYNCQVSVVDPTGGKAAFWQAPVMLVQ